MTTIDLRKQERVIEVEVDKKITDDMAQKRYFVAELVKKGLDKYLDYDDIIAKNESSIYTLPIVNKELSIIDFEINSLNVHVIATFDKAKNKNVHIPSLYKQYHFKPDMFIFVNFSKSFAKMELIGFYTDFDYSNLSIEKTDLLQTDNLVEVLQTLRPQSEKISAASVETAKELIMAYIDNDLSDEGKRFFMKTLLDNKELREAYKIAYTMNSDFIAIAKHPHIEKFNPADRKIELHSRSDYMIDKAISKYKDEEIQQNDDTELLELVENGPVIETEPEEVIISESESLEEELIIPSSNESVLQLSLEPLNIQSAIEEENEEDEPIFEEDNSQDNDDNSQQEEVLLQYEDNNVDEVIEEPEIMQTNTIIEDEVEQVEEETSPQNIEEYSLLEDDEEQDLHSLDAEEEHFDLMEDNITQTQPENITAQSIEEQPETFEEEAEEFDEELEQVQLEEPEQLPEMSEDDLLDMISEDDEEIDGNSILFQETNTEDEIVTEETEDEDLFAFLTEIADEKQEENTNIQNEPQIQHVNEEFTGVPVANEEITPQFTQDEQQQPEIIQNTDNINIEDISQYAQETQPEAQSDYVNPSSFITPNNQPKKSNRKLLIAALLVVCGVAAFQYRDKLPFINHTDNTNNIALDEPVPPPIDATQLDNAQAPATDNSQEAVAPPPTTTAEKVTNNEVPSVDQAKTLPTIPSTTVEPPKPKHLNDAIATALTKDFNGVRISKLSWEISETLVNNPDVKRYLTIAGKSVKNTLAQDLMASTEPSFKDTIVVGITYKKDGSISKITMDSSSGSKQIDDIILKSVKSTLNYLKMPSLNLKVPEYNAKMVIRL